jgi:hypothetical protein
LAIGSYVSDLGEEYTDGRNIGNPVLRTGVGRGAHANGKSIGEKAESIFICIIVAHVNWESSRRQDTIQYPTNSVAFVPFDGWAYL